MPWFLRQLTALGSGDRPTFQSETAPLSMTHCNTKHTRAPSSSSTVPAGQRDSWECHASSCNPALGNLEGFLFHTWMSLHCLSSTAGEKKKFFHNFLPQRLLGGLFKTVNSTYVIWDILVSYKFSENCFCNRWSTDVTLKKGEGGQKVSVRANGRGCTCDPQTAWHPWHCASAPLGRHVIVPSGHGAPMDHSPPNPSSTPWVQSTKNKDIR